MWIWRRNKERTWEKKCDSCMGKIMGVERTDKDFWKEIKTETKKGWMKIKEKNRNRKSEQNTPYSNLKIETFLSI